MACPCSSTARRGRESGASSRQNLDGSGLEQVTPADIQAFTPRASADGKWLVASVLHGKHRQIELIDLATKKRSALTDEATDHWNPSISADGRFGRLSQDIREDAHTVPNVELWGSPPGTDNLKMVRLGGSFPAFSPDGKRLALVGGGFARLDVMNIDGTGRKHLHTAKFRGLFSTSWAHHGDRIALRRGRGSSESARGRGEPVHHPARRLPRRRNSSLGRATTALPPSLPTASRSSSVPAAIAPPRTLYVMSADGSECAPDEGEMDRHHVRLVA